MKDLTGSKDFEGGNIELNLKAEGHGNSMHQIMGSLNGESLLVIGKGRINQTQLESSVSDKLFSFLDFLNPLSKKQNYTNLECAAIRFKAKNGIAYALNNIGIETGNFLVLGSGQVDLRAENLDFEFQIEPKTDFNIEIGSFANFFRVEGPLSNPKI